VPPTLPIATQPALDRLGAYAAARGMSALLFGVAPSDPATFATAVGVTLLMTVSGSLVPAIRAVRVSPMSVLRAE
jgi:putative ABC transport system permease protein